MAQVVERLVGGPGVEAVVYRTSRRGPHFISTDCECGQCPFEGSSNHSWNVALVFRSWSKHCGVVVFCLVLVGLLALGGIEIGAAQSAGGNEHWDPQFGSNGLNDQGLAIDIATNGDVYVGGRFSQAGDALASHIARWDGSEWHPLGLGTSDNVVAIEVVSPTEIYAGGSFLEAGGRVVNRIARFDGSAWTDMNGGANNFVEDITVTSAGDVYAAGWFTQIGGISTAGIARWNGIEWNPVGGGVNGVVTSVVLHSDGDLYVAGSFTMAGGTPVEDIARWDGTQWNAVGSINGNVRNVFVSSDAIYAGGSVLTPSASNVAIWDPISETWTGVGPMIDAGDPDCSYGNSRGNVDPSHFYVASHELFCFPPAMPNFSLAIAEWNGSDWLSLGDGPNSDVVALARRDNDLYVTGAFTEVGGIPAMYFGRWNPTIILNAQDPTSQGYPPQSIVRLRSNPSPSGIDIALDLNTRSNVTLSVYDTIGRLVSVVEYTSLNAGVHDLHIALTTLGVYLIVADLTQQSGEAQRITRKATITN